MDRNNVRKKMLEEHDKCELCGDTRNLEVHHIVPFCTGYFTDYDLDTEDNLIVLCSTCHAKLTRKTVLINYGVQRVKYIERIRKDFYNICSDYIDNGCCSAVDVMDAFDEWFSKNIRE